MKNALFNPLRVLAVSAMVFSACSSANTDENDSRRPFSGGAGGTTDSGTQPMGGQGGGTAAMGGAGGSGPDVGDEDAGGAGSGGSPGQGDAGVAGQGGNAGSGGQGGSGGAGGDPQPTCESSEPDELQPVTDEYSYLGVSPSNAQYKDSPHFRVYYGGSSLSNVSESSVDTALNHLEAAYGCFVTDWCFRSTGLSVHSDDGPYYKMNIYPTDTLNAGGVMLYDDRAGLSYLEVRGNQLARPQVTVHEFGHSLALTEYNWVDQTRTGAWWETVANWVADTYLTSPYCEDARDRFGVETGRTLIDLGTVIGQSHLTICHEQNLYQAWPFLTYLTNNPDGYSGLGRMVVRDLFRQHQRNNETPLHVLERVASPVRVQTILGRYWARMAYLDIGHPQAQQVFFENRSRLSFSDLSSVGNQTYRVDENRQPMYGGANIIPLDVTGAGDVTVEVTNLGNGLPESNFTATLAIRAASGSVRYVELEDGSGRATLENDEEITLVVANTPDTLYQYDPFQSDGPELEGLNYEVEISGAAPAN